MDDFEQELQQALERRPAPPNLKRRIMERRGLLSIERRRTHWLVWQRVAAGFILAVILAGGMEWRFRKAQERRQGEEARRQVMVALRITGHALNEVNEHLSRAHSGDD